MDEHVDVGARGRRINRMKWKPIAFRLLDPLLDCYVWTPCIIKAMCLGGGPSKKNASGMRNLSLVTHAIGKADYVYRAKRLTSRFLFPDSLFSFNHIHGSLYLQSSALVRCSSCSIIQVQTFTNLHGDTAN